MSGRLLLVEDDKHVVELLRWHLEREEYAVVDTPDGDEALLIAKAAPPDMILLDWMIEGPSGIEVCRRLRRCPKTAAVPIIMVTARGEESDRICGLDAGADDYIAKPFSPGELVARIGAVLRRSRPKALAKQLSFGDLTMDLAAYKVRRAGRFIPLSLIDFRLLRYFMESPGQVFSRQHLLHAVWQSGSNIDARTVDAHIVRLRTALRSGGDKDLIRTVRNAGYALDDDA